jgi:hypothetical protein
MEQTEHQSNPEWTGYLRKLDDGYTTLLENIGKDRALDSITTIIDLGSIIKEARKKFDDPILQKMATVINQIIVKCQLIDKIKEFEGAKREGPEVGLKKKTRTGAKETATASKGRYRFDVTFRGKRRQKARIGELKYFNFTIQNTGTAEDSYQVEFGIFNVEGEQTEGEEDKLLKPYLGPAEVGAWKSTLHRNFPKRLYTDEINPRGFTIVRVSLDIIPEKTPTGIRMIKITVKSKKGRRLAPMEDYYLLDILPRGSK